MKNNAAMRANTLEHFDTTTYPEADVVIGVSKLTAIAYEGKQTKRKWYYTFGTEAHRERFIANYLDGRRKAVSELAAFRAEQKAKRAADRLVKIDLPKLTADLAESQRLALMAAKASDDGGTCNMDGLFLRLPNVLEGAALAAIRAAGLSGHKMKHTYYGIGYLISPRVPGQGNKRDRAASAMCKYMAVAGYDLSHWQQMD